VPAPPEVTPRSAWEAFELRRGDVVALVGGGGKTTLRGVLASQASAHLERVLTTVTTKTGPLAGMEADAVVIQADRALRRAGVRGEFQNHRWVFSASRAEGRKWIGVEPDWIDEMAGEVDLAIVEADGCRQKPFKAHGDREPVIPPSTTLVIPCIGAEVIGAPLTEECVHRSAIFTEWTGVQEGRPMPASSRSSTRSLKRAMAW
jgi:probable selenium-dependent hydroxylase accessory protein YqeC